MKKAIAVVSRILWALAAIGAGTALVRAGMFYAEEVLYRTSPDFEPGAVAVFAALQVGLAVTPYVLARAWDEATRPR